MDHSCYNFPTRGIVFDQTRRAHQDVPFPSPNKHLRLGDAHLLFLPLLLLLEDLPLALGVLADGLNALLALALLVEVAALEYALHDGTGVDVVEPVRRDLAEDAHLLGRRVRVVRQRDEGRRPVVDGVRQAVGQGREVRFRGREGGPEDDCVDVLL